jgi:hypothetical protein
MWLYCKGADNVVLPLLARNQAILSATMQHCEQFASAGLRTLVRCRCDVTRRDVISCAQLVARKLLLPAQFAEWKRRHDVAAAAVDNRDDELQKVRLCARVRVIVTCPGVRAARVRHGAAGRDGDRGQTAGARASNDSGRD